MYKKAGINDVRRFYAEKFVRNENFDVTTHYLWKYNINFSKYLWIYRNVKPNSIVMDFGCGSGTLSILKQKGCRIIGIDYSEKALKIAKEVNKYDSVFCGSIFDFKHPEGSFDYIVSLDVFGHIPFEEKDMVIQELKRFLKPDGVMLHGIECGNVSYENMNNEELRCFIEVDGHVGIENKRRNIERFKRFFKYVEGEVRFSVENHLYEYIKQFERYGAKIDFELIDYLKVLSYEEKRAFDIANGLIQIRLEEQGYPSPDYASGFLYLRASDVPLHEPEDLKTIKTIPLGHSSILYNQSLFFRGWYEPEADINLGLFRWGNKECLIRLTDLNRDIQLNIFSHYPEIETKWVRVFFINYDAKELIDKIILHDKQEHTVILKTSNIDKLNLCIYVDTTWKPALYYPESKDWRTLGIGIRDLRLL